MRRRPVVRKQCRHWVPDSMRGLVQRVTRASVTVDGELVGSIGPGLCVLVGVTHSDTSSSARKLAGKLWHLRIMDDEAGVMNRSVADTTREVRSSASSRSTATSGGAVLSGSRPPGREDAEPLVQAVADELQALGATVATGRFRTEMLVELVNDGPVTAARARVGLRRDVRRLRSCPRVATAEVHDSLT
jgi:D-tyrosyl-tRNA(Tyr) deacylase